MKKLNLKAAITHGAAKKEVSIDEIEKAIKNKIWPNSSEIAKDQNLRLLKKGLTMQKFVDMIKIIYDETGYDLYKLFGIER